MDQQQGGYRIGNLGDLEPRYRCTHCHLLLREPMQADCGHRYCRVCVLARFNEAKRADLQSLCPACDASEVTEVSPDRTYPDAAMKREIFKVLLVQCPNAPCQVRMKLEQLDEHMTECEHRPKPCHLCDELVSAADVLEHAKTCPKRLVPCSACKELVQHDRMEEHKSDSCVGNTVACQYCLARIEDTPEAAESHLLQPGECLVAWHDKNPCPFGCTRIHDKNGWAEHRQNSLETHLDRALELKLKLGPLEPPGAASVDAVSAPTPVAAEAADFVEPPGLDYDALAQLKARANAVWWRLEEVASPSVEATGGGDKPTWDALGRLHRALGQGEKLGDLMTLLRKQLEQSSERIRKCEINMQKELINKQEMEKRHQELLKLLAHKEMKIQDLERRADILEHAGFDGILMWKINNVRRRMDEARDGTIGSIYSPPFFTSRAGYKLCARLYLNGDGPGKNSHVSLYIAVMRGSFDALLPWPFAQTVRLLLVDQSQQRRHVAAAFKPSPGAPAFKRPVTEINVASGLPTFVQLGEFVTESRGFIRDDTIFIRLSVDTNCLPS